ncbi:vibriobactin synthase D [Vibrio sp. 10N.222.52.B12]|uniref:4'-phosphopantetheinyl transferase family protein n=1 Tax=Vibrio sp. 10N.222.52.B12 TaxID=1880840 RepID=UPI000CBD54C6|nr:4'-phosphopantetheinyl transferase superfamily protein [Vibrio sp. 10N.222.52.B12]PMO37342.1 vibriobactin synthase D [Vibrio sp. 10N.222.52.B12]
MTLLKNDKLVNILAPLCLHLESASPTVHIVKATPDMYDKVGLLEEEQQIHKAVKKRQREFRAGRQSAREAIKRLVSNDSELAQVPILSGKAREPLFPSLISGSISHTDSLCLAACALKSEVPSLGIDVENNTPLASHLFSSIYTQSEKALMETSNTLPDTLIFSIKESLFKCLYPFVQVYFDFLDAQITLQPDAENAGQFHFELIGENRTLLQANLPNLSFHGRYCFTEQYVFSLCFFSS